MPKMQGAKLRLWLARARGGLNMKLKEAILEQSRICGLDPYKQPFKPADIGIKASDYGSFSDYCSKDETCSGKWNQDIILKVVEWTRSGKPKKYLLLHKN
jgi:hypothetical protein